MKETWFVGFLLAVLLLGASLLTHRHFSQIERWQSFLQAGRDRPFPGPQLKKSIARGLEGRDFQERPETHKAFDVEVLLSLLERGDPEARLMALTDLRASEEPAALEAVGHALADPDPYVRRVALRVVMDMASVGHEGHEVIRVLQHAMSALDPESRIEALDALAEQGQEGIRAVQGALSDPDDGVRQRAQELLGSLQRH